MNLAMTFFPVLFTSGFNVKSQVNGRWRACEPLVQRKWRRLLHDWRETMAIRQAPSCLILRASRSVINTDAAARPIASPHQIPTPPHPAVKASKYPAGTPIAQ